MMSSVTQNTEELDQRLQSIRKLLNSFYVLVPLYALCEQRN